MASKNGIGTKLLIVTSILIINSLGVLYFARDNFNLPQFLEVAFNFVEASLYAESEQASSKHDPSHFASNLPIEQKLFKNEAHSKANALHSNARFNKHTAPHTYDCLDKLKPPGGKTIYTWVDGKGVKHLSDSPRKLDSKSSVRVANTISAEAMSLNFLSHNLPFEVRRGLRRKVQKAMQAFAAVTPKESIVPVVANIRSFSDESAFKKYSKRFNYSPISNGFYASGKNESVILVRNNEQALNTVTHEVMHTINRHWYGQMAKWLNEGMAEYAENLGDIRASGWESLVRQNNLLPLNVLVSSSGKDWLAEPQTHYATSWAFVTFLTSQKPDLMSRLLLQEAENGCSELSTKDIEKLYGYSIVRLQRDFLYWINS